MVLSEDAPVTVFCAVWSGDPDRWDLLRAHQACLEAQTVPVSTVCVFDDGDVPPDWVTGTRVLASQPLTIYQAWNVATQVSTAPYVMNLNLDDRLAPDAVECMVTAASSSGAALVGADWRICYTQEDTDAVTPVHAASDLPFVPAWPPGNGTHTRLGSGTGERGTFGPATLWQRQLHTRAAYPWAFGSGDPITVVGDLAWWVTVTQLLDLPTVRLPQVVGSYHSHPATQAEFRAADETDTLQREGVRNVNYPLAGITVEPARTR